MALAAAIEGARLPVQRITWVDADGTAVDLTGATLTGTIEHVGTRVTRAIDGTLTPTVPETAGIFDWTYGTVDVATHGHHRVQFIATYGTKTAKTIIDNWTVHKAL